MADLLSMPLAAGGIAASKSLFLFTRRRKGTVFPAPSRKPQSFFSFLLCRGSNALPAKPLSFLFLLRAFAPSRDGVDAPRRHLCARMVVSNDHLREASMGEVTTIGLDLAKQVF
ncbi:MAG TPA: hypothetical protein VGF77_13915, partial [Allosphingosinicella sp.]